MSRPQYAYFDDPLKLEFDAQIVETRDLGADRWGVILDQTYFYPTGGGQAHDTGLLGEARVLDVWRDGATSQVVHVVERELAPGSIHAEINPERRQRHMQHHTAQHLLSACFYQLYGLETLSSSIHGDTPSTIDLPDRPLTLEQIISVENLAHEKIFTNLGVKTYFVEQDQRQSVPFRRPPKVDGEVRVVEIDAFDYSACGATHCPSIGMIGMLKIVKTERQNQKNRVHFVAGIQALSYFQEVQGVVDSLAEQSSTHYAELPEFFARQSDTLKSTQKELVDLKDEMLSMEAERLLRGAQLRDGIRWVVATFDERPTSELQIMTKALRTEAGVVSILATWQSEKFALLVACADDVKTIRAGDLLKELLQPVGGRGGGSAQMAQGGGLVDVAQYQALKDRILKKL
ncbi:MAG: hypothetical protein HN413_02165 [Chloroflexi bacterium]|nr:hypothetical protein [Chloroflexota bacterium]